MTNIPHILNMEYFHKICDKLGLKALILAAITELLAHSIDSYYIKEEKVSSSNT